MKITEQFPQVKPVGVILELSMLEAEDLQQIADYYSKECERRGTILRVCNNTKGLSADLSLKLPINPGLKR